MIFNQDRQQIRDFFRNSWNKFSAGQPAEPLELMIGEVIAMHPEYQAMLEDENSDLDRDYHPEDGINPFLHMGLHLSLREQMSIGQPEGIKSIYQKLLNKLGDAHATEHLMIECLADTLMQAQHDGAMPDEDAYMSCLLKKIRKK